MKVNYAKEYKKFKEDQKRIRAKYLAAGMTEEQIAAMYDFDKRQLARDLAYRCHAQEFPTSRCGEDDAGDDSKSVLYDKFSEALSVTDDILKDHSHFGWIDEIDSTELLGQLISLKNEEKELLTLYVFEELKQSDIARILGVSQSAFSQQWSTIKKKIKKFS